MLCASTIAAQSLFIDTIYEVRVEKDLVYDLDTNYLGQPVELKLDLY
ncbi:MAG: hypothetical protein KF734_13965 [Saprospiraceae bacterium]|nr:hypothetical protein [Saprospiraceae bacterium]